MEKSQENLVKRVPREEIAGELSKILHKQKDPLFSEEEILNGFLFDEWIDSLSDEEYSNLMNSPLSLELNPQLKGRIDEVRKKIIEERAMRWQSDVENTTWPFDNGDK